MPASSLSAYGQPSLSPLHLMLFVIRPALTVISGADAALGGDAAEELVLGTAAQESKLRALDQVTSRSDRTPGPAYGLWQMERSTHDDIWENFLRHKPALAARVRDLMAPWPDPVMQLMSNLSYGAAMCRIHYFRAPAPLPQPGNPAAQAAYWKRWYNTPAGKGQPADYIANWATLVAPHIY